MGSHQFSDSAFGETAEQAFKQACDDAQYEEGHNAYNGTISTNDSFVLIPTTDGETREEWETRVEEDVRVRKWGPCACTADPDEKIFDGRSLWWFTGWAAC